MVGQMGSIVRRTEISTKNEHSLETARRPNSYK